MLEDRPSSSAAAALGVTEPYSAGIGGGGFMVVYLAGEGEVVTIDGRKEAPADPRFDEDVFLEGRVPIPFFPERITSGLAVGVPGTFATWVDALERYGTITIAQALQPGRVIAQKGFVVDETFAGQTLANLDRFRAITSTADRFLVDGDVPAVGSVFRNPDLARTYRLLQREGLTGFYGGALAEEIAQTVQDPPVVPDASFPVRPGFMTVGDLADYALLHPDPTMVDYRGYEVFGMGPPSAVVSPWVRRSTSVRASPSTSSTMWLSIITCSRSQRWRSPTAMPTSATTARSRRAGGKHRSARRSPQTGRTW